MPSRRHFAPLLLVPVIAAFLLWLFVWPAARLAPRDVDLGVVGSDPAVTAVEHQLAARAGSHAFDLHRYADQQAARRAIEHRDIYGALVVGDGDGGSTLMTASAASPAVSNLLQQMLAGPGKPGAARVKLLDVVALPSDDPRGSALGATLLPMLVTASAGAALSSRFARSLLQRIGLSTGTAVLSGLVAGGIVQSWLGIVDGNWAANAGVFALASLAVTTVVSGLTMLGRTAGLAGGAVLMVLAGNAYSGNTSAPELLPRAVGWIGRLLPPGASAEALRSTAFFHGNGIVFELVVLAAWSLIGLALITIGTLRARTRVHHLHGAHARSRHTTDVVAQVPSSGPGALLTTAEDGTAPVAETAVTEPDSIQVVRTVPVDSSDGTTGAVGVEVTLVARIDAKRITPALETTTAG